MSVMYDKPRAGVAATQLDVQGLDALKKTVLQYWPILAGLLVLYLPTIYRLAEQVWIYSDQAHGPLILAVTLYLFWQKTLTVPPSENHSITNALAYGALSIGLCCYVVGSSQALIGLEVGSVILVVFSLLILYGGLRAVAACWFPLFFLCFLVPLPGSVLDFITLPMKMAVSTVAEQVLYWFGYPVARDGVMIHVGQYQLFVANACAGMHTLISLEALGLLYITLVKHASFARNMLLGLLIIPISFTANVIRVMALVLITFYFGDAVAQGFIHGFASVFLFAIALVLIVTIDATIQRAIKGNDVT